MSEPKTVAQNICTRPNKEQLAQDVVDGWDLDDVVYYATWKLVDDYENMPDDDFIEEYVNFHGTE